MCELELHCMKVDVHFNCTCDDIHPGRVDPASQMEVVLPFPLMMFHGWLAIPVSLHVLALQFKKSFTPSLVVLNKATRQGRKE